MAEMLDGEPIDTDVFEACPTCQTAGWVWLVPDRVPMHCPTCFGDGVIPHHHPEDE